MGNKDAHRREVKKPKKKKPKPEAFSQAAARILREAPKSYVPGPALALESEVPENSHLPAIGGYRPPFQPPLQMLTYRLLALDCPPGSRTR